MNTNTTSIEGDIYMKLPRLSILIPLVLCAHAIIIFDLNELLDTTSSLIGLAPLFSSEAGEKDGELH